MKKDGTFEKIRKTSISRKSNKNKKQKWKKTGHAKKSEKTLVFWKKRRKTIKNMLILKNDKTFENLGNTLISRKNVKIWENVNIEKRLDIREIQTKTLVFRNSIPEKRDRSAKT